MLDEFVQQGDGSLPARGVWIEIADAETTVLGLCRSPQGECGLKSQGRTPHAGPTGSLPARGVWIEMLKKSIMLHGADGRSPQGECGLKYYGEAAHLSDHASLPARGVWIEIGSVDDEDSVYSSLPARGVWIEITCSNRLSRAACRSPQGECGLK